MLSAKEFIAPGLIDSVGQHRAGIAAKFPFVILHCSLEIAALIEVVPTGLFQKGIATHHGDVQLLSEFCGIGAFSR